MEQGLLRGTILSFLFELPDLVRLNIGFNNFSGSFPTDFNSLTRLKTLFVENNQLSGPIPDLSKLSLNQFNFSHNLLNGSVPLNLQTFPQDSFLGNSLYGYPLSLYPGDISDPISVDNNSKPNNHTSHKLFVGAIAGIVVGLIVFLLLLVFFFILLYSGCSCGFGGEQGRSERWWDSKEVGVFWEYG